MNQEQFETMMLIRLANINATLTAKADEYARGDRLSNFKKIADMLDTTPEKALIGLVMKHIVALVDFIDDIYFDDKLQPYSRWDEKIGDVMAYMVLLDAMVQERIAKQAIQQEIHKN